MSISKLLDSLNADNLQPVYLFHGSERFFIDEVLKRLKEIVANGPMAKLNLEELKGDEVSGEDIVTDAQQIPMLTPKRLVIVENAHTLSTSDFKTLDTYFEDPSPKTCLVLVGENFSSRLGAIKRATERGQVFLASPLKKSEIIPFLKARAHIRKVKLSNTALSAISTAIGPDSSALDDAVERLGLYAGVDGEVGEADVTELVPAIRQHSVFELVDAIGSGQASKAVTLLANLLAHREEPIMINTMVARHVRQLLGARIHLHLGTDRRQFARVLGAPTFMVDKLIQQARRYRGATLEKALKRLAKADFELKSSRKPSSVVLEGAVLELTLG